MSRVKKVQQTRKKIMKNKQEQEQKTAVRRLKKLGVGRHEAIINNVERVKGKDHLIKIALESTEDGRKGTFIMYVEGYEMDSLLESICGDVEEDEFYLEDLIGNRVIAVIVRNGKFLNVDYFESLDNDYECELEEIRDEDLELELEEGELYGEDIELDEEDLEEYL